MSRSHRGRIPLLVFAVATPWLVSAALPEPPPVLRWAEVAAAVERHPAVREASARERAAAGGAASARELPNPVVGVTVGDARPREGGGGRVEWEYSVELPLDFLATRGPRVEAALAEEESARQERRSVRARALRELRGAFVALAYHRAVVAASEEQEAQVMRLAALVRKRVDHGEGRPSEVPRVEIELERLRGALDRSRAAAEGQRLRLQAWLEAPVGEVEADLAAPLALPPLEALLERALASSAAIEAARARVRAATAEASAARRERFPKVALQGSRAEELDRRATVVGATVALPLWSWNRGGVRRADAVAEAERARLDAAARELAAGIGEAWQGCAAGQSAARRFRSEVLPRAEGSAGTLGRAFELGEAGLLDVVDARRVLLDARREYLDLLLEMQDACGDLAALADLELP